MKKQFYPQLFFLFALFFTLHLNAQQTYLKPTEQSKFKAPEDQKTGLEFDQSFVAPAIPEAYTNKIRGRVETEVNTGSTTYDLQTNASICNRFTRTADGMMFGTWTMGNDATAYPDRGTGYNAFDGNDWGDEPDDRLEENARTGWPNYVRTDDGTEFIVSHVFDSGAYRLHYLRRAAGETEWTEGDLPTDTPFGSLWPRATQGGADGNSIHVISITTSAAFGGAPYEGVSLHIIYHRSQDAGATWDKVDAIIPGLDSTLMRDLVRADAYAIDAREDVIAVGLFSPFNDVKVFKSEDNGETWTDHRINDFPIDQYEIDQGYTVNDIPVYDTTIAPNPIAIFSTDGAGTVLIDHDDMVHVFYGEMFVQDTAMDNGGWFFFPCTSGIAYWNENFGEDSIRTITSVLDLNGNEVLDIDCANADFGRYGIAGLTSYPSAGIDPMNNIYLSYQMTMEGDEFYNDSEGQRYHHVHLMASLDGGETWTEPYDLINEEVLLEPDLLPVTEGVFAHVAKNVDSKVHLIYQQDFSPGMSAIGDEDDPSTNFINYVGIDVTDFGVETSTEEKVLVSDKFYVSPNPASSEVRLFYELGENSEVSLNILNVYGQLIHQKNNLTGFEGLNSSTVNLENISSGIYLLQLKIGNKSMTKKLIIRN